MAAEGAYLSGKHAVVTGGGRGIGAAVAEELARLGAALTLMGRDAARRIIEWSGAPRPTSLRHDAAEAVLIGFWGVLEVGWLDAVPPELRGALPPAPTRAPRPREAAG